MKTLETERLILRAITKKDANAIYDYAKNPNVGPRAGWPPHKSLADTKAIMKEIFIGKENIWGIVLKEDDTLIGTVGLVEDPHRENNDVLMLGYSIGEDYWGKGYTTEASREVLRYGFEELKLPLISASCYAMNTESRNVIEKVGMQYEGRQSMGAKRYDSEIFDILLFSIKNPLF